MTLKGFTKLSIQIGVLSISMIALSFLTDTQIWLDWFNYEIIGNGSYGYPVEGKVYYHWNYRAFVYFITGLVFFVLSVIKIALSHKEEDFK